MLQKHQYRERLGKADELSQIKLDERHMTTKQCLNLDWITGRKKWNLDGRLVKSPRTNVKFQVRTVVTQVNVLILRNTHSSIKK